MSEPYVEFTGGWKDRPTSDLIVAAVIGGIVWRVTDTGADIDQLITWVGDLVSTLVGAVVGYLAGRGAASTNTDGQAS
jgi:crotonobetainyl-CoA:carnitine CoA-transferase CaiB-like acyl-CoA transferase